MEHRVNPNLKRKKSPNHIYQYIFSFVENTVQVFKWGYGSDAWVAHPANKLGPDAKLPRPSKPS